MDERGEYRPLDNTSSPPHEERSSSDMDDASNEVGVNYAKSFHLRFAGNSTVRKQRPKLRKRREDAEDDSTDDEYGEEGDVPRQIELQNAAPVAENGFDRDSQEIRLKLSQRE